MREPNLKLWKILLDRRSFSETRTPEGRGTIKVLSVSAPRGLGTKPLFYHSIQIVFEKSSDLEHNAT
jgi:hypothetical protein